MTTLEITIPELVKRYQAGEIPEDARAIVTYGDSDRMVSNPALALAEEWLAQVPTDPEEIQAAEEDLLELQKALNTTRKEAGARIPFPPIEES